MLIETGSRPAIPLWQIIFAVICWIVAFFVLAPLAVPYVGIARLIIAIVGIFGALRFGGLL